MKNDNATIVSYAQYNEDIILLALLHDVEKGLYVDVGANYPTRDSVTKLFYDKGWRGINIEPIARLHALLEKERPEDTNLKCGVSNQKGKATLREYINIPGHSTFDSEQKAQHDSSIEYKEYDTPLRTLEDIFSTYIKEKQIHFVKVDVEGFEYQVLDGNNWDKYRPEVLCVEANHMSQNWRPMLQEKKYKLFIEDGLNEYYIAEESWSRTYDFADRSVLIASRALRRHQYVLLQNQEQQIVELQGECEQKEQRIQYLTSRLKSVESLSLHDVALRTRLKRAIYGITIDWYQFKKRAAVKNRRQH